MAVWSLPTLASLLKSNFVSFFHSRTEELIKMSPSGDDIPSGAIRFYDSLLQQYNGSSWSTKVIDSSSLPSASSIVKGAVKLSNSHTSISTNMAATPSAVRDAYLLAENAESDIAARQKNEARVSGLIETDDGEDAYNAAWGAFTLEAGARYLLEVIAMGSSSTLCGITIGYNELVATKNNYRFSFNYTGTEYIGVSDVNGVGIALNDEEKNKQWRGSMLVDIDTSAITANVSISPKIHAHTVYSGSMVRLTKVS